MNDPAWWKNAVIYELYIDKFAHDIRGLVEKIDYFQRLGINTLWILPHYPTPGIDDGYDISDYFSVRPDLGTVEDFKRFIEAAHARDIRVVTDMVLNHTSDAHPWFMEARASKDNPRRSWYMWNDNQEKYADAFVHFSHIKKTNWIFNAPTGDFYYATFYPQQPDLNWDNPEVENAMLEAMDYWLDMGVDGFRLDAISRLVKRDGTSCFALPETHRVLKRIRSHLASRYPNAVMLAEAGGWPDEAKAFFGNGDECHLVINFPLAARLVSSIAAKQLPPCADLLLPLPDACHWATFLTNHDSVDLFFLSDEKERGEFKTRVDPQGLYSVPQSNSLSARLGEICKGNADDIVWATEKLLAQPGIPIIYYGNEIGMRNQILTEAPPDTRTFVRGEFDWPEADKQISDPNSVFSRVSQLIKNRPLNP
jgi:maltose alpha-D-glucosyltransferase / alpha-amylase